MHITHPPPHRGHHTTNGFQISSFAAINIAAAGARAHDGPDTAS